jgi:nucleolar protein 56
MFRVYSSVGVFVLDEGGELVEFRPFESDEEAVRVLIYEMIEGKMSLEQIGLYLREQKRLLEEIGIGDDDYSASRHRIAVKTTEEALSRSVTKDVLIIQAVETLQDVNKSLNILTLRFAGLCSTYGIKVEIGAEEVDFRSVLNAGKGVSSKLVEEYSKRVRDLVYFRDFIEREIEEDMLKTAPNITGLVGPVLGARLLARAKGLGNLANMPGSRIQVLGAEAAMFRHLRERGKPPKHGVIFEHPTISRSPWWQRGKIARSLAAKLALAARLDFYSGVDRSDELRKGFMDRYVFIKERFVEEPKRMRIIKAPKPSGARRSVGKKKRKRRGRR